MRLYIDLDTLKLRGGLLNPEAIPNARIDLKRGDTLDLDVLFVRDSGAVDIDPAEPTAAGRFMLKRVGEFDGDPLVAAVSWTKIGAGQSALYRFSPSLNTVELNAELGHDGTGGNDIAYADLSGEVEWVIGSAITSTIPFSVRVWNDIIKGNEGVPQQATPPYPESGDVLTKSGNLAGLADPAAARTAIGVGNVDDTRDADKPVSSATQTALNQKAPLASPELTGSPTAPTAVPGTNTTQIATTAHVKAAIEALLASAPGTLDTLNELAAALGNDANFAATVTSALALKAPLNSAMGVIVHGANAATARPAGYAVVTWVGTAEPINAANNDIWEEI